MERVIDYSALVKEHRMSAMADVKTTGKDFGSAICMVRQNVARSLSVKISESETWIRIAANGSDSVSVRADLVVMALDEFVEYQRKAFRSGVEHANSFIPPQYNSDILKSA